MGKTQARLRKGSGPCQAVCASGRAGPRRALSSSSSPWISFQSPNTQSEPCRSHPVPRTCGQWAEQEGHTAGDGQTEAGDGQTEAACAHGALFWGSEMWLGGKRCPVAQKRPGKGSVWCSGDLMPQAAGMEAAPHQHPRAGWETGGACRAGGFVLFILLKAGNPGS